MPRMDPKKVMDKYKEAQAIRSPHESDWEIVSAHCMPRQYQNGWRGSAGPRHLFGGNKTDAARRIAYDSTGALSVDKWSALLHRLATPESQRWHSVRAANPDVMKNKAVREHFDLVTDLLFKWRYDPAARFVSSFNEAYATLGVIGTAPIYVDRRRPTPIDPGGLFYRACNMQDIYLLVGEAGDVRIVFRRFWLNARQFMEHFPDDPIPKCFKASNGQPKEEASETDVKEFFHVVEVKTNEEFKPHSFFDDRFPVKGNYVCVADSEYVGKEHGFNQMPYLVPRIATDSGQIYGYSPAMQSIAAMGSASAAKKSYLKVGQRAADQVLLAHDDAVVNGRINLNPGQVNYGGLDSQGREMVKALDPGRFDIAERILEGERRDIQDSFFVTLFDLLVETPQMTATEVIERTAEKSALLAPTLGRLQTELLGPCIEREIGILRELGVIPEPPPEFVESGGEYEIIYESPMARSQHAEEVSGSVRAMELGLAWANGTGNPAPMDHFNLDVMIPEIAEHLAMPARFLNSMAEVETIREARAQAAEMAQAIEAAPGLAGLSKATEEGGL